jgi:serine/threonine-protein kinase
VEGNAFGQYRIVERLGGGGMGAVYRALDTVLEREVALKILGADVDDPEKRFRAEAVAIARLSHPGLAAVYELFQHDDRWIMVMELVRGETLEQIVDRVGPLPPKRAAELCMQALTALAHAHAAGVVHRDLKPANLMITITGGLKIMDFGIALVAGAERLTNDGYMMGTPAYMAPEQVTGRDVDGRADLYAMGVVFYRLVTGRLPFKGDTPYEMAQAHLKDQPIPVDLIKPDVPLWVKYILDLALAKSPDQRFQSADAFFDALKRAVLETSSGGSRRPRTEELPRPVIRTDRLALQTGRTDRTPRPGVVRTGRTSPRSRSGLAIWTGIVTMAAAVSVVVVVWLQSKASAGPPLPPAQVLAANSATPKNAADRPARTGDTRTAPVSRAQRPPSAQTPRPADTATIAVFSNLKLLEVSGPQASDRDVMLSLSNDQVTIVPPDGRSPIVTLPYARIEKATYVHAAEPKWVSGLAGPVEALDVTGVFGRARHWLSLQSKEAYAILRLDGNGWQRVIEAFESISGRRVDRATAVEK